MTKTTKEKQGQGITSPLFLSIQPSAEIEKIVRGVCLKRLYTVEEAALYLGRGVDSVREMIWRREIPIVQRGDRGKIWLDIDDLTKWVKANKHLAGSKNVT